MRPVLRARPRGTGERENQAGTQRAVRLTAVYLVALAVLYGGFVLYDRTTPGGSVSPASNGLLTFTLIFVAFAAVGTYFALTPAPRAVEVAPDHVTVVGRWGRRRELPPLEKLSLRVVRKYSAGWLSSSPVELVEVWAENVPVRSYLADARLFEGVPTSPKGSRS